MTSLSSALLGSGKGGHSTVPVLEVNLEITKRHFKCSMKGSH